VTTSQSKIPLLGDIPLIGALFRKTSTEKSKQNLLLFLTPYIVRTQADLRHIYERKMRERQEFLDRYFVFGTHDYHPSVDYSRTRGLVAEIVKEVDRLHYDKRMAEEMASRPSPQHVPMAAIGSMNKPGQPPASTEPAEGDTIVEGGQAAPVATPQEPTTPQQATPPATEPVQNQPAAPPTPPAPSSE
jgi:general secretion pathway protein D